MARDRYDDDDYDRPRGNAWDRPRDDWDDQGDVTDDYNSYRRGGTPPANNLAFAIFATICCCTPAGIVAIIYAAQVNSKWYQGDYAGAEQAANNAKTWCWISFGLIAVIFFLGFLNGLLNPQGGQFNGR